MQLGFKSFKFIYIYIKIQLKIKSFKSKFILKCN